MLTELELEVLEHLQQQVVPPVQEPLEQQSETVLRPLHNRFHSHPT